MEINLEDYRAFKNDLDAAYFLMYDARDNALTALRKFVEDCGGEVVLEKPVVIGKGTKLEYDVDAIRIGMRGDVCFCVENGYYSFKMYGPDEVLEFLEYIMDELIRCTGE